MNELINKLKLIINKELYEQKIITYEIFEEYEKLILRKINK